MATADVALVQGIAEALGPAWVARLDARRGWSADVVRKDGASIWLGFRDPGRVEAMGSFPSVGSEDFGPHHRDRVKISCAVSRGPVAIARDIQARLLPWYETAYREALERQDKRLADQLWEDRTALDLAEVSGCDVERLQWQDGPRVPVRRGDVFGTFAVSSYDQRITIELRRVPVDVAHRIMALLMEVQQ